jgi:hypothetical protein
VQISVDKVTTEARDWTFPKGSVRVPTDQPLGDWIVLLLEPQSSESFFAWGMIPEVLSRVEYIEPYAIAPLAEKMLAADPALKAEFEAKLAAEPKFAADPRRAWPGSTSARPSTTTTICCTPSPAKSRDRRVGLPTVGGRPHMAFRSGAGGCALGY